MNDISVLIDFLAIFHLVASFAIALLIIGNLAYTAWKFFTTIEIRPYQSSRSSRDGERLTDVEFDRILNQNQCPDCTTGPLYAGPSGGDAQNYCCGNKECGSRFNVVLPFGIDRISDACPNKREKVVPISIDGLYR